MLFICTYLSIGFILGCFGVYKMLEKWGWQHLLDDFNSRLKGKATELKVFKISFPLFTIVAITLTWPYFVYLFFKKKYYNERKT